MSTNHDTAMTSAQRAVWDFLLDGYVGHMKATPRRTIIARFNGFHAQNAPILHLDDRTFRDTVSLLVSQFNKPICTTSGGGYFVARTPDELDYAVKELESRGKVVFERARALKHSNPLEPQRELF